MIRKCGAAAAAFVLSATAAGAPAWAATASDIVERHIKAAQAGDLSAIMADYADSAVVVTPAGMASPDGVYVGKTKATAFFKWLLSPPNLPGVKSMKSSLVVASPDTVIMNWVQFKGTPKEVDGRDVFVVRKDKVVFQVVAPKP